MAHLANITQQRMVGTMDKTQFRDATPGTNTMVLGCYSRERMSFLQP
jgi:hypothetical protein